jgi:hypothetical protein
MLGPIRKLPLGLLLPLCLAHHALRAQTPLDVRVGGYIQTRETYQSRGGLTASLNRARASVDGRFPGGFSFRLLVEYEAPTTGPTPAGVSLRDAYIRWSRSAWSITAGQFKTPFSREFITSITMIETADRAAVVDALAPKRDIGVMGEYAWKAIGRLSLGVFNGEGQNVPSNRDSAAMVVGRVAARPVPWLSLAANYARFNSDSSRYGFDSDLEYRGASLKAEYDAEQRSSGTPQDHGWFAVAAYRVVPWIQLVIKQEDFERPSIATFQRNRATTGGVNLEFSGGKVRLLANYVSRKLGTGPIERHHSGAGTVLGSLGVVRHLFQNPIHQGQQGIPIDRFSEQFTSPLRAHICLETFLGACGHHHDWNPGQSRNRSHLLQDIHAATGGHLHIEQNDLGRILTGEHVPLHGIVGFQHEEAGIAKNGGRENHKGPVIVDDEQFALGSRTLLLADARRHPGV